MKCSDWTNRVAHTAVIASKPCSYKSVQTFVSLAPTSSTLILGAKVIFLRRHQNQSPSILPCCWLKPTCWSWPTMPKKLDCPIAVPHLEPSRKAGDVEPFPSGKITYLAPLPLPTPLPPHGPHIGQLNEAYMDFGLGSPQVFMWQVTIGGPFTLVCMFAFLFPLFSFFSVSFWDTSGCIHGSSR